MAPAYICAPAAAAKSCQSCLTLQPHRRQPTSLPHPWDSPGKNTGVGSHALLREIFPTRDQTQVSCIAGGFFTS